MLDILLESVQITLLVFVFMLVVELLELRVGGFLKRHITSNRWLQYVLGAVLGLVPGCNDAFVMVTFYISGIVTFGALVSVMAATFGDEAFVLISYMGDPAMQVDRGRVAALLGVLFVAALVGGVLADWLARRFRLPLAAKCEIAHHDEFQAQHFRWGHFFTEHAFRHVFLKHIPSLFLWMLGSLLVLHLLEQHLQISGYIQGTPAVMILMGAAVGLLPFSGPHLVFITLFVKGTIPLSVVVANSIVQEGHGLLPLLSYSLADGIKIKLFKLVFGLVIGFGLLAAGF